MTHRLPHRSKFRILQFSGLKHSGARRVNLMFHSFRRFEPFQLRILDSEPSENAIGFTMQSLV